MSRSVQKHPLCTLNEDALDSYRSTERTVVNETGTIGPLKPTLKMCGHQQGSHRDWKAERAFFSRGKLNKSHWRRLPKILEQYGK